MTPEQVNRAVDAIALPDGDGFHVRVYTRGGHVFQGGIHNASDGMVRLDQPYGNNDPIPAMVACADIVAVDRVP